MLTCNHTRTLPRAVGSPRRHRKLPHRARRFSASAKGFDLRQTSCFCDISRFSVRPRVSPSRPLHPPRRMQGGGFRTLLKGPKETSAPRMRLGRPSDRVPWDIRGRRKPCTACEAMSVREPPPSRPPRQTLQPCRQDRLSMGRCVHGLLSKRLRCPATESHPLAVRWVEMMDRVSPPRYWTRVCARPARHHRSVWHAPEVRSVRPSPRTPVTAPGGRWKPVICGKRRSFPAGPASS